VLGSLIPIAHQLLASRRRSLLRCAERRCHSGRSRHPRRPRHPGHAPELSITCT
jgi:hypothetical protein